MGKQKEKKVKSEEEDVPTPESKDNESVESSDDDEEVEEETQQKGEQRDSILLGFFWDLASADIGTRNKSVQGLLEYLITKQKEYEENFADEEESMYFSRFYCFCKILTPLMSKM